MTGAVPSDLLEQLFRAAVDAALPDKVMANHLPVAPKGRTLVTGAGKASAAMARALEAAWPGELSGLVVTRYGHAVDCENIEIVEAAHPVPDQAGLEAATRIVTLARELGPDDLMIALISGGGSALLALPAAGLSLDDKQAVNRALLTSGATIEEMNTVRKHLSAIKGGRLAAAAAPARVCALMISDIPGDDPSLIASGPCTADASSLEQARAIIARYDIALPGHVAAALEDPANESPKPGAPELNTTENILVATPALSLEAAQSHASAMGIDAHILSDRIEGEARDIGLMHAALALEVSANDRPFKKPCVLLSGGETTVTVRQKGRGGRNAEFALSLALGLDGRAGISAIACDTDGIDGTENNAGARLDGTTLVRGKAAGLNARAALDGNDAYGYFAALGDLVMTGPTLTNVNDFRAILIV
jgi:hydroxypyruvate reductase